MRTRSTTLIVLCLALGVAIGWGSLHMPSAGLLALGIAVAVTGPGGGWRHRWPALLAGAALPWLWFAWVNRHGPGWRTWESGGVSGGSEFLDPAVFLTVALPLLAAAALVLVVGQLTLRTRSAATPSTTPARAAPPG